LNYLRLKNFKAKKVKAAGAELTGIDEVISALGKNLTLIPNDILLENMRF